MDGRLCGKIFTDSKKTLAAARPSWMYGILRSIFPWCLLLTDILIISGIYLSLVGLDNHLVAEELLSVLAVVIIGNVMSLHLVGGYSYRQKMNSAVFLSEHVVVSLVAGVLLGFFVYGFFWYGSAPARSVFYGTVIGFPIISILYRIKIERIKQRRQSKRAICILGNIRQSLDLAKTILASPLNHEVHIVALESEFTNLEILEEAGLKYSFLRNFDPEKMVIGGKALEHIILAMHPDEMSPELVKCLIRSHSTSRRVVTMNAFHLNEFKQVPMSQVSPTWAFGEGFRINSSLLYNRIKRAVDLVVATTGLVVVSPLLLATAIAVRVTSKGPIFFFQERIGRHEVPFTLCKFRTMKVGADKLGDYTQDKDPRLTPIGEFLRRSRLDEIPQLFNVIKGEMSIIGPRPEWSKLVADYESKVELYHYRHLVRPGITGWAQVNYSYGANLEDTIEKLKYDLYYVRYYSLLLDMSIVVKTFYTMLFGKGK
jgi:exopolysaccharide biosynthesis polyprenyl glycosylphosphotransferase